MAFLFHDIVLDDTAFKTASDDMASLKQQAADLKTKLEKMYEDVTSALDTSAGDEIQFTAKNVLLQPIEDMSAVIQHISDTLNTIIGTGYYKDIFVKFEELNECIKRYLGGINYGRHGQNRNSEYLSRNDG